MINHEIEIKFSIKDQTLLLDQFKKLGARFKGKAFERTIRFDTPDNQLEKQGKFLRLRSGFKNVITFKSKISNKQFKEREEIEFEVEEQEKMRQILERLGFTKIRIMEKYRQKWECGGTEIVVDKLLMGIFMEIEGPKINIEKICQKLGLDLKNGITKSYWEIWEEYCKRKHLDPENIVFNRS
jgi:predicted adenylyl cyclase CyaB